MRSYLSSSSLGTVLVRPSFCRNSSPLRSFGFDLLCLPPVDTRAATAVLHVQMFFLREGLQCQTRFFGMAIEMCPAHTSDYYLTSCLPRISSRPYRRLERNFFNSQYLLPRPTMRVEWEGTSLSLYHPLLVRGIAFAFF